MAPNDPHGISRGSSCPYQSSWMSHWSQEASKHKSFINPHSSTFSAEPSFSGRKQNQFVSGISFGSSKFLPGKGKETEAQVVGFLNGRSNNLIAQKSDYESFWSLSLSREKRNTMPAQTDPGCGNAMTTSLSDKKSSLAEDLQVSSRRFMSSHLSAEEKPFTISERSGEENVISLASAANGCKEMHRDLTMGFSMTEVCVPRSYQGVRPLDMGNVFETRRICPTVDNSPGSPSMFSQTTHHFLFPEKNGADFTKRQQIFLDAKESAQYEQGVRIQPLVSSTDDAQEMDGGNDAKIVELDTRYEASTETRTMNVGALLNKNNFAGLTSSEPIELQLSDQQGLIACGDLQREKILGKRPITEKASINKNLPSLPLDRSVLDGIEPGTSKTLKLDIDGSRQFSKCDQSQDPSSLTDPSIRWVKRLKPNLSNCSGLGTKSSEMVESTSHEKHRNFCFNNVIGSCQTNSDHKETIGSDGNIDPSFPSKKKDDMMLCCYSWIQRWCQNPSPARKSQFKSPSLEISEPDSSNLAIIELIKGQIPSIHAMALMGRSLNGLWRCELTRRGPLVIWNTKEL